MLGSASPTVAEMAEVYGSIASGGVHRDSYVVQSVTRPDGSSRYEHETTDTQGMDEEVAINATVALQGPPTQGSARDLQNVMGGRPVAGKTGTSESFRSAWFVGFTPQLVTAVGMFQPSADGTSEETLTPFGGEQNITGGTFPTQIWGDIMSTSLEGEEYLDFPEEVQLDNETQERSYVPPPTQEPEPTQAPEPTQEEPSEEPTTEEPTTEEPTTEEPTTEEPEPTEEPTTEEPEPTEQPPSEEPPAEEEPPADQPTEEPPADEEGGEEGGEEEADAGLPEVEDLLPGEGQGLGGDREGRDGGRGGD